MRFLCALLLPVLVAGAGESDSLVYLGVNEQGAEEWMRIVDGAVVVRVPRGPYAQRPYEGRTATEEPKPVFVESFFVDKFEVTNAQFARFLNAADEVDPAWLDARVPGLELGDGGAWRAAAGFARHPVTAATGRGALAFAAWAGGAIPSRAQWEKAAGGPDGCLYPWGADAPDARRANFGVLRLAGPRPVGSHPAGVSPYGCHDMAGNVYDRVMMARGGALRPVMIKGGAWVSTHPLNLRVLDMCVQPMQVAERSVGFRCVMADPEPERATRKAAPAPVLRVAKSWDAAVAEARKRRVPIFLSLQFDTCGQCDRTRAQLFRDPRFVAYCNERMVVAVGHKPGDAAGEPHAQREDETCTLYAGLECWEHEAIFNKALPIVERFVISPGNFVLHPDRVKGGAGAPEAILIPERALPKWGNAVDAYLAAFERARKEVE